MITISVPVSRPYPVCIGKGRLKDLGLHLAAIHDACTVAIISDTTVLPLYGETVAESLRSAGFTVVSYAIPSGESYKNLQTYGEVLTFLAQNHLTRTDLIVALGGGVVGDLAGFAAATYQRGIDYVQVPTTLLSAVDSSVGGKTAVDLTVGKNLVGAFHQPLLVWCDPDTLDTLPGTVRRDGCAEVIKYGLLGDAEFFAKLQQVPGPDITEIIARCVEMKRDIVCQDEFDHGQRQLLNLGHTFGHAIEAVSNYTIGHGHCVAMGMAMICRAAAAFGTMSDEDAQAVIRLLEQYGLPTHVPYSLEALSAAVLSDKKIKGSTVSLILPRAIGQCEVQKFSASALPRWLAAGGAV